MRIEKKDSLLRIIGNVLIAVVIVILMAVGLSVYTPVQNELQYNKLTYTDTQYDAIVQSPLQSQLVELAQDKNILSVASFQETKVTVKADKTEKKVSIMFFEESTPYYISTFNENSLIKGKFDVEEGVVIDKTAQDLLKVSVGDTISYTIRGKKFESVVNGIVAPCKISLYNKGLILSKWSEECEKAMNAPFHPTVAFIDLADPEDTQDIRNFVGYGMVGSFYEYMLDFAKNGSESFSYSQFKKTTEEEYGKSDKSLTFEEFACEHLLELTRNDAFTQNEWKELKESDYNERIQKITESGGRAEPIFRLDIYKEFGKNTIEKLNGQCTSDFAIFVLIELAILMGGYTALIVLNKKATSEQLRIANNISAIQKRFYVVALIAIIAAVALGIAIGNLMNIGVHMFDGNVAFLYTTALLPLIMVAVLPLLLNLLYRKELRTVSFNTRTASDKVKAVQQETSLPSSQVVAKKSIYINSAIRMPLPLYLVQVVVAVLFAILFSSSLMSDINQLSFHAKADYEGIVYSDADIKEGNSYISLSGAKYRANVELIDCNAELLMIRPDEDYSLSPLQYDKRGKKVDTYLQKGQCVVSSNLLKDLGLKVGDKINIKVSSTHNELNTIVAEFPNSYGLDPEMSADGIIVIGYNETFEGTEKYVSFVNIDKMLVNARIYSKSKLLMSERLSAAAIVVGYVVVYTLLAFLVEYLFEKNKCSTYRHIYLMGMKKSKVRILILKELLMKYAPLTILVGFINFVALIYFAGINSIAVLLLNVVAVLMAVTVNWIVYNRRSF